MNMRVVLDTNVLISAMLYGGKPRIIHQSIISKNHQMVTSPILLSELADVLRKKFAFTKEKIAATDRQIRKHCEIALSSETIDVVADIADNRILEAAVAGECDVIITGDSDLLRLKKYRSIRIFSPDDFLKEYSK